MSFYQLKLDRALRNFIKGINIALCGNSTQCGLERKK